MCVCVCLFRVVNASQYCSVSHEQRMYIKMQDIICCCRCIQLNRGQFDGKPTYVYVSVFFFVLEKFAMQKRLSDMQKTHLNHTHKKNNCTFAKHNKTKWNKVCVCVCLPFELNRPFTPFLWTIYNAGRKTLNGTQH